MSLKILLKIELNPPAAHPKSKIDLILILIFFNKTFSDLYKSEVLFLFLSKN